MHLTVMNFFLLIRRSNTLLKHERGGLDLLLDGSRLAQRLDKDITCEKEKKKRINH